MTLLKPHMAKQLLPSPLPWLDKVRESCLHTPATRKQHICLWNMEIRAKRHSVHWDRVVFLYVTLALPRWIAFHSGCDFHKAIFMGTEIDLKPIAFWGSTCVQWFPLILDLKWSHITMAASCITFRNYCHSRRNMQYVGLFVFYNINVKLHSSLFTTDLWN